MAYEKYFSIQESEQFTFYRVPKALFTNSKYKVVSSEAKLLYGLLLDRMGLSAKNGWCDNNGLVFIYFTIDEAKECLNCGHEKAGKLFYELEKIDLVDRRKQGLGKPAIIYVKKFISDIRKSDILISEKPIFSNLNFSRHDNGKSDTNNNNKNYTEKNNINPSIRVDEMEEILKKQIEYDIFIEHEPSRKKRIGELISIMTDAICNSSNTVRISGSDLPKKKVYERFMKLNFGHIQYVLECLDKNPADICNIRSYLLTALYNAPVTIDSYYSALVNYDLYGGT
jgi:hypothetical protein